MLTPQELAEDAAMRARLAPIAAAVGLPLKESDGVLIRALETIASRRETLARKPLPVAPSTSAPRHLAVQSGQDVGDRAVELMRAKREGREPAAWATQPLSAGGK